MTNKKIKTLLMGTPEFAERIFRKIYPEFISRGFEIIGVITASDKPVGRKQILMPSPVKIWALENNLLVLQPQKIKNPEEIRRIKELNPDLILLCAYGQIIPKEILEIPKYGPLNIHPSLLPNHRGASPIQATILNDDKETGVSLIMMDEEMDHGPIIQNSKFEIRNPKINYKELSDKLIDVGADLVIKTLPKWVEGKIKAQAQDHSQATFCKLIKKEDGKIDWNKSAEEIERQIRAFREWPTAYTFWNNKQLKILEADILDENKNKKVGEIFLTDNKKLAVQTGDGILIFEQVQLEGKKPMSAKDFLNGHSEIISTILK